MKFISLAAFSAIVASTYAASGLTDCYWEGVVEYCYHDGVLGVVVPSADESDGTTTFSVCYTKVGKTICLNDGDDKVVWYEGTAAASVAETATVNDYYTIYESATTTNPYYAAAESSASAAAASSSADDSSSATASATATTTAASGNSTSNSTTSSTSAAASSSASTSSGSGAIVGFPSALAAIFALGLASLY